MVAATILENTQMGVNSSRICTKFGVQVNTGNTRGIAVAKWHLFENLRWRLPPSWKIDLHKKVYIGQFLTNCTKFGVPIDRADQWSH